MPLGTTQNTGFYAAAVTPGTQGAGIPATAAYNNREDLLDMALNLDKGKTAAVFQAAPKTTANGMNHEWFTEALPATSTAGTKEGVDWASAALTGRVRMGNSVQTFSSGIGVSLDQVQYSLKGRTPGVDNEYNHQVSNFLLALEQSVDARAVANATSVRSVPATASAVTALMAGIRGFCGANAAAGTQGSAVTAAAASTQDGATLINIQGAWNRTYFLSLHEAMFTAGANPDTLAVDPGVKNDITLDILGEIASSQPGNASAIAPAVVRQQYTMASYNEFAQDIQFMRTPFGRIAILIDRFIPASAASAASTLLGGAYFLYERANIRFAFWRPMRHYPLPPNGDSVRGYVHTGVTLEALHPGTVGIGYGIST